MIDHPKRCPACDRPVEAVRFGVPFTQLKAAIIDKIKSRNGARIHAREIFPGTSQHTMRAHIYQINEKLMDTEWRIDGTMGIYGGYRIVKRKNVAG